MTFVPQNKRSREMWELITRHVDFQDKSVIDVGCGYGDFCFYAWMEGAQVVAGVDKDTVAIRHCAHTQGVLIDQSVIVDELYFTQEDIEEWDDEWSDEWDIAMCFSLLPYLEDPYKLLYQLYENCTITILEVQYHGDGPGLPLMKNDDDMAKILGIIGWDAVGNIGSTLVSGRNKRRTIWVCRKLT